MSDAALTTAEFRKLYSPLLIGDRTRNSVTGAETSANETLALSAAQEMVLGQLRPSFSTSVIASNSFPLVLRDVMYTYAVYILARRTGTIKESVRDAYDDAQQRVVRWSRNQEKINDLTADRGMPSSNKTTSEKKLTWDPTATITEDRGTLDGIVSFPDTPSGGPT